MANRFITVSLSISADKLQAYYSGAVRNVAAKASDGRMIHFPVNILRPFVDHNGVRGRFQIEFDENNKFVGIERLG